MGGRNVKQQIIVRNLTHELSHKLPKILGLTFLRNEELLRLLTWVFIDLMIREFELITRGFELITREFELVTHGFELITCGFELVTRGPELVFLSFNSCF